MEATTPKDGSCWKLGHKMPQDGARREGLCAGRVGPQNVQDVPKMFPRCLQDVWRRFKLETPLGECSERGERSDQGGLGELPSESRSKDTVRVRAGRRRKAIQHVSPRGFIDNALPVLLLTPGLSWSSSFGRPGGPWDPWDPWGPVQSGPGPVQSGSGLVRFWSGLARWIIVIVAPGGPWGP